ncbi:M48 family metalloprotease [Streptomyces bottropensis]|uniref:M48 family metalloprotease n=1 Tax=Streptomyces bottropensis TaxID=42235 RepID=A0ABU8AVY4_9ACTN
MTDTATSGPPPLSPTPAESLPTSRHWPGVTSSAGARYLLLVAVLLLAGAFAGQIMHNQILGTSWASTTLRCIDEAVRAVPGQGVSQEFARNTHVQDCTRPVQLRLALVSLSGSFAVLLLGVASLWVLPRRLMRQAGPLVKAPAEWQHRAALAASETGVRRVPVVVWGSVWLQEAFTAGRPGRTRIVLPRGVRDLPPAQADAILRHELAHVAAGDVTLVWLTRGVWWALAPVLLVPTVTIVVRDRYHEHRGAFTVLGTSFWGEYGVRALLLLTVAALISQHVLRSREHEADLRSLRGRSREPLESLLAGQPSPAMSWVDRARATHPTAARRLAALRQARLPLPVSLLDVTVTGLLSAMVMNATAELAQAGFTGTSLTGGPALLLSALVTGSLLSVGWGIAVWRGTPVGGGAGPVPRGALLALAGSMPVGLVAQLQSTGTSGAGPSGRWPLVVTLPLAVAGAGALSSALARLWVRRGGAAPGSRWGWAAAVGVNLVLFTGALRIAQESALFLGLSGWRKAVDALALSGMYSASADSTALGLAGVALFALWLALRGDRTLPPPGAGATTGRHVVWTVAAAAGAAVAARWAYEPVVPQGGSLSATQFDCWAATCAGLATLAALLALKGASGLGDALYAAPLSAAVAGAVMWARYLGSWHHPLQAAALYATNPFSQLALLLLALALPAAFLPTPTLGPGRGWVAGLTPVLAAVLAAAGVLAVLHSGDSLLFVPPTGTSP